MTECSSYIAEPRPIDGVGAEAGAGAETEGLKRRFLALVEAPMRVTKAAGLLRRDSGFEDAFLLVGMVGGALDTGAGSGEEAAPAARAQTLLIEGIGSPRGGG